MALWLYFIILFKVAVSYWISENRLVWSDALNYCVNVCNSNLASFHNESDYLQAKHLIINSSYLLIDRGFPSSHTIVNTHIWIGLNDIGNSSQHNFSWTDGSTFDFGDDLSGGIQPWKTGEPNHGNNLKNENCVGIWLGSQSSQDELYKWNDYECDTFRRFMCNSCEGVLDKYIVYAEADENWDNADNECMIMFRVHAP